MRPVTLTTHDGVVEEVSTYFWILVSLISQGFSRRAVWYESVVGSVHDIISLAFPKLKDLSGGSVCTLLHELRKKPCLVDVCKGWHQTFQIRGRKRFAGPNLPTFSVTWHPSSIEMADFSPEAPTEEVRLMYQTTTRHVAWPRPVTLLEVGTKGYPCWGEHAGNFVNLSLSLYLYVYIYKYRYIDICMEYMYTCICTLNVHWLWKDISMVPYGIFQCFRGVSAKWQWTSVKRPMWMVAMRNIFSGSLWRAPPRP